MQLTKVTIIAGGFTLKEHIILMCYIKLILAKV
jgi:hypothetical protein